MSDLKLGAVESRFAEIIWQNEPIASGKLVKLCEKELNWKKPTTYTVLRKLCKKGIFQNENGTVTSKIKKDDSTQCKASSLLTKPLMAHCPLLLLHFQNGKAIQKKI